MKPNALDSAVVAVLCCCTERLVRRPGVERPPGSTRVDLAPTAVVIEPWPLRQSPLEQLSAPPSTLVLEACQCHDSSVRADRAGRLRRAAVWFLVAIAIGVLAVLAIRADAAAPHASPWLTTLDLATGLAFVVAAAVARGPSAERVLMGVVGVAWLTASFLPATRPVHQAVLVVSLVALPTGRVRGLSRWLLVCLAVPVGVGLLPQIGVAAVFALVALLLLVEGHRDIATGYPTVAAIAVAAVLGASWSVSRLRAEAFDPSLALVSYELVLLAVAAAFPVAAQAVIRSRARLADRLLAGERLAGLEGFAVVLGRAVSDPSVQVFRWHGSNAGYVDERGRSVPTGGGERRWITVVDAEAPVAAVAYKSPALDDPGTAEAVTAAVRLAVRHKRLQHEQQQQLSELEASRARIVAAADRERERAATQLREDVGVSLELAQAELSAVRSAAGNTTVVESLDIVVGELAAAQTEIVELVAGVPPAYLGSGRLHEALQALAQRSPVPVSVTVVTDAASDQETEAALFYVCSEALANAVKHADAKRIGIIVRRVNGAIVAVISDDGRGGAHPTGSGLQGLADRLATLNGRLRVDSPPGSGTTVTAVVPN
jgi:signal transduction histidine kinase